MNDMGKESLSHKSIVAALMSGRNISQAALLGRFFKTGPGQYGEGDKFLGLSVPFVRSQTKRFQGASLQTVAALIANPYHEVRLIGLLILVSKYERAATEAERKALVSFYLAQRKGINNWDLVDLSAYKIIGDYVLRHPAKRTLLYRYARSKNLWERRIAVVSTMPLIKQGEFKEMLQLAVLLMKDREDLMHKAVGWMLREVGKKDEGVLRNFLDQQATLLPRTALRYAIERLPEKERLRYLRMK